MGLSFWIRFPAQFISIESCFFTYGKDGRYVNPILYDRNWSNIRLQRNSNVISRYHQISWLIASEKAAGSIFLSFLRGRININRSSVWIDIDGKTIFDVKKDKRSIFWILWKKIRSDVWLPRNLTKNSINCSVTPNLFSDSVKSSSYRAILVLIGPRFSYKCVFWLRSSHRYN